VSEVIIESNFKTPEKPLKWKPIPKSEQYYKSPHYLACLEKERRIKKRLMALESPTDIVSTEIMPVGLADLEAPKKLNAPIQYSDYIGKKINQLTLLEFIPYTKEKRRSYFICRCECGKEIKRQAYDVVKGHVKSCNEHKRKSGQDEKPK